MTTVKQLHKWSKAQVLRTLSAVFALFVTMVFWQILGTKPVNAGPAQPGFEETVVFGGLINPTALQFAPDGRIFVAEKRGVIKVFDSESDTTPTVFADLRTNVYNFWDRGLLGLALDPNFPTKPYIYVLYTYDAVIGGTAPKWGSPATDSEGCPNPPGATGNGCVVSGRLSRLQANGNVMTGSEQVLVEDWCQQFPSHSVGSLVFGADGALYASAGDGASFGFADYGQAGDPVNPCGDPPGGVGSNLTPPTAEGGALRSQDLRTTTDPAGLDGTILRINPDTGEAMPDNPLIASADKNTQRIIAYGLRNPFRINTRPGTSEIWIGDVGWNEWEEINRITNPTDQTVENFGWPCYEGQSRQNSYDAANLNICENLYNQSGAMTEPFYSYHHQNRVVNNEACPTGSSSVSGISFQFYTGGAYPPEYNGAMFFADYSRNCIWVMFKSANSDIPSPANIKTFISSAAGPVDLRVSPQGELFYADLGGGTIRKIKYTGSQPTPTPVLNPLPSPWLNQDVGPVGMAGSSGFGNNTFTVRGSGIDIWDHEDSFQYAYQPLSGDGTITARVATVGNTYEWAKAGVMIRETLAPGAKHALAAITAGRGAAFQRRLSTNGISTHTGGAAVGAPFWVKLARSGNVFTAQQSGNGTDWTTIGTEVISMGTDVYIGLAVTAHNNSLLNTSTFDNVAITNTTANQPPSVNIAGPTGDTTWKVGDTINFSGSAVDPEDGDLPASSLTWSLVMQHCPDNCHAHPIQTFVGSTSGSFTAPDHEYPSYLELKLTAEDTKGLEGSQTVKLMPQTVNLNFQSNPVGGMQLVAGAETGTTPFGRTVINGSNNTISAVSPQTVNTKNYEFVSWSDNGAQTHNITATSATTLTATYREVVPGQGNGLNAVYWNNMDFSGATVTRADNNINFDWGGGSPDPAIGADTFSARWTGQIKPTVTGNITFYTQSDDGVRLWVNNQQVINNWTDHPATENSGVVNLTAGTKYDIKMEFYENGGGALAKLLWSATGLTKQVVPAAQLFVSAGPQPTPTPTPIAPTPTPGPTGTGDGLRGEYFDNLDLTGAKLVRVDQTVDFDWGLGSPDPAVGAETFSVRWTGQVSPQYSETYTFYTQSDDGVRLWVNNQQLVNNWTDHALVENSGTINLTAGNKYDIRMEFYDNTEDAVAKLWWSSASTPKQAIPKSQLYSAGANPTPTPTPQIPTPTPVPANNGDGLKGEYFDNLNLTNLKLTRTDPTINFNWGGGSPAANIAPDTFSARWTGFVVPQSSQTYTFYTGSDDGVRLWVNNQLLIDKWIDQGATEWSGTIGMTAGQKYPIRLEYYENGGGALVNLKWSTSTITKQVIPQSRLFTQ